MNDEIKLTAGVDECGRGPLAGPVVAAAVILPMDFSIPGLTDSKKLTGKQREKLNKLIKSQAIDWSIAEVDEKTIDEINILNASLLAMKKAILILKNKPDKVFVDGLYVPSGLPYLAQAIVKGDAKVASISAASIIAKVYRDSLFDAYEEKYPGYGFATNKGYPTAQHIKAIDKQGIKPIHRKSFAPVAKKLQLNCL